MDATALSTVQKPQKILARKGKHQVGAITSGERGTNTTVIWALQGSLSRQCSFSRVRFKNELAARAPPGTQFACSESGWITSEIFVQWFNHFIHTTKPTKEEKVLLLLDGHTTHTKNTAAINLAIDNGIIMLSLPAHTTHRLQPLDVAFFKPLSVYFNQAWYVAARIPRETYYAISDQWIAGELLWTSCNCGQCSQWIRKDWSLARKSQCLWREQLCDDSNGGRFVTWWLWKCFQHRT